MKVVFDNWYVNGGVEYADFAALGLRYLISDLASSATELTNAPQFMAANTQGFITTDITALGINSIDGFAPMDGMAA